MLAAQDEASSEVDSRDDAGRWLVRRFGEGERSPIAIGCTLEVDIVYREATKNARAEQAEV